jgi:hypothetical protein
MKRKDVIVFPPVFGMRGHPRLPGARFLASDSYPRPLRPNGLFQAHLIEPIIVANQTGTLRTGRACRRAQKKDLRRPASYPLKRLLLRKTLFKLQNETLQAGMSASGSKGIMRISADKRESEFSGNLCSFEERGCAAWALATKKPRSRVAAGPGLEG